MTKNTQLMLQAVINGLQPLVPVVPGITQEWHTFCHVGLGVASTIIGIVGHYYNPDGTPAAVAYVKEE